MFLKICCVLVLVPALETSISFAQDPTKAESAHYKLAFENEHVQVINIHYGPHEKSNMHQHPGGVVVNLTNGHLRFTDPKGVVQEVHAIHGESRWFPALKHKVENLSDVSYDAVYIGVKGSWNADSSKREAFYLEWINRKGFASMSTRRSCTARQLIASGAPQRSLNKTTFAT